METTYAILTGDLVRSSELDPEGLDRAMEVLREAAVSLNDATESVVGRPDFFRGDGWQLCLSSPDHAIAAAAFVRVAFIASGMDSRIGIGVGRVERLNAKRVSQSIGSAFTLSGRALDELGPERRLSLAVEGNPPEAVALAAGVRLLDSCLSGFTQTEAAAVFGRLLDLPYDAIARLPQARTKDGRVPSRQNVFKALKRIHWQTHLQPFLEEAQMVMSKLPRK